ncbi:heme oxygenase [Arachnomyces sp. PD_36]|nr:heme oxygenase [Arachnomyces sp. PD_36]
MARQANTQRSTAIDPSIGAVDDLPTRIHAATRTSHANLNRLITARLPLSLPPHASTPQLYALGLSRFAEIYFAFEKSWTSQVNSKNTYHRGYDSVSLQEDEYDVVDSFINDGGGRVLNILRQIYDPELLRSAKLRSDLRALGIPEDQNWSHTQRLSREKKINSKTKKPEDEESMRDNAATKFAQHITITTRVSPHLLLAYTWIMYMALFNGGRWIHGKLEEGGADFWDPLLASDDQDSDTNLDRDPTFKNTHLSFWSFPTSASNATDNSEVIKSTFRTRFLAAEMLLTEHERNQVIDETIEIFRRCSDIVNEIDLEVARGAFRESRYPSTHSSSSSSAKSNSSSTITGIPSITIQSPSASSSQGSVLTSRQPQPGIPQPRRQYYINPLVAGAAGLLGGLCAWFWNANSEAVQWGYRALIGG